MKPRSADPKDLLLDTLRDFGGLGLCLFTGAGLSAESGIPLWWDLRDRVLEELFWNQPYTQRQLLFHDTFASQLCLANDWMDPLDPPPETVVLAYYRQYGEQRLQTLLRRHLSSRPSGPYPWLAELIVKRLLGSCVTVNVDKLMDSVLLTLALRNHEFKYATESADDTSPDQEVFSFLRLHGCIEDASSLCLTPERVEQLDATIARAFGRILYRSRCLIFYGYAGNDPDIALFLRDFFTHDPGTLARVAAVVKGPTERFLKSRVGTQLMAARGLDLAVATLGDATTTELFRSTVDGVIPGDGFAGVLIDRRTAICSEKYYVSFVPPEASDEQRHTARFKIKNQGRRAAVFSVPASSIMLGSYSVYVSGEMLLCRVPLRTQVSVCQGRRLGPVHVKLDKSLSDVYAPWYATLVKHRYQDRVLKEYTAMCRHLTVEPDRGLEFSVFTSVPYGLIEDNLSMALAAAVLRWHGFDCDNKSVLATAIAGEYAFRPTASYLYLIPAIPSQEPPTLILARRRLPPADSWAAFAKQNRLTAKDISEVLQSLQLLERDQADGKVAMHLCCVPKYPLVGSQVPSVQQAVETLDSSQRGWLRILASVEARAKRVLFHSSGHVDWETVGRVLTAVHHIHGCLGRGDQTLNRILGALSDVPGVLGGCRQGAGPGGALLVLLEPLSRTTAVSSTIAGLGGHSLVDDLVATPTDGLSEES